MESDILGILIEDNRPRSAKEIAATLRERGLMRSERTLRRYLQALVSAGEVRAEGRGVARSYWLARGGGGESAPLPEERGGSYPPLSTSGASALRHVTRPRHLRAPAGYNPEFLLSYVPNEDSYLSSADRTRLSEWGQTPDLAEAAGTFARDLAARLLIDLSWASSHLEGNTYSLLDTQRLVEHGQQAEGKDADETQMILNHKKAIEILVENAQDIEFNRFTVVSLHAALAENLLSDANDEGRLRTREVGIGGSTYMPLAVPQQIEEYFMILLTTARGIADPFEQSFFAMVHLPYLQPFVDVNKRTSRLAANIPFIKKNLVPLSFLDVSREAYINALLAIYENNDVSLLKDVFLHAYQRSSQRYRVVRDAVGEPDPFRQKHRALIHATVRDIILNQRSDWRETLEQYATRDGMSPADARRFAALVTSQLDAVREENAGRYGISPSQFRAWRR